MATYADEFYTEISTYERMKECGRIYGFRHYQSGNWGSSGGMNITKNVVVQLRSLICLQKDRVRKSGKALTLMRL